MLSVWIAIGYSTSQCSKALPSSLFHSGLDTDKLADDTYKFFGPGTEYEQARRQLSGPGVLQLALMFLRHSPVNGPWTNHCLKTFVSNRAAGKTPEADGRTVDPDGLVKVREGERELEREGRENGRAQGNNLRIKCHAVLNYKLAFSSGNLNWTSCAALGRALTNEANGRELQSH